MIEKLFMTSKLLLKLMTTSQ